jgi:hypothetical protein
MAEITLDRLRQLRDEARLLSEKVVENLEPFKKQDDNTFRRLPTSRSVSKDIGVTTTCSCLMALALTDTFGNFYDTGSDETRTHQKASNLLQTIFDSPWMSSGLADNNAFTTSLVVRTYGFLRSQDCLMEKQDTFTRSWELSLKISNPDTFAVTLREHKDETSRFIWHSLSDETRDGICKLSNDTGSMPDRLTQKLARDLRRIIEGGWIEASGRFDKMAQDTKGDLASNPTGYQLVEVNRQLLSDQYPLHISRPGKCDINEIARQISTLPNNFAIDNYPPSAAVIYWFLDGVTRARIPLAPSTFQELCAWAANEFNHKRSLVVSNHEAMMDPIALGMSACLCALLRRSFDQFEEAQDSSVPSVLPSEIELDRAVVEVIRQQTQAGIWHKYFPFFHYQDVGSNFCFAFEFLEALLCEFGNEPSRLMDDEEFIKALERAVTWCKNNQCSYRLGDNNYSGWNSGGQLQTLEEGKPESWATAVVHMFLSELQSALAGQIQRKILKKYKAKLTTKIPKAKDDSKEKRKRELERMLNIRIKTQGLDTTLSDILTNIVNRHHDHDPDSLRRKSSKGPLSALLFGPPGTSKTQVTKAVASDLEWPLVEITPSDFVKGNLDNVYIQANEIFADLMDLAGVVVFFDEMDALVQTRADGHLDMASQFLTTMMLPKLTELHDKGQVVFFMATNFQERFDPAIKRAGRFDLLLCMGPPTAQEKIDKLEVFFGDKYNETQINLAKKLINEYIQSSPTAGDQLELLTFGEFKTFLKRIGGKDDIGTKIEAKKKDQFLEDLKKYCEYAILRMDDLGPLQTVLNRGQPFESLSDAYAADFSLKQFKDKEQITNIIRYLADRRESKDQH